MAEHEVEKKVLALYRENKWKDIIDLKDIEDNSEKHRLLWVWPSLNELAWIKNVINSSNLQGIISIGCGSGLLEWLIEQYSGLHVIGVEVDRKWWFSGYSPPLFLKNVTFIDTENNNIVLTPTYALLFCYFNNSLAFYNYMKHYHGNMVLVIGPGEGRGSHTDPTPFDDKFKELGWRLIAEKEIRNTKDYITVHIR